MYKAPHAVITAARSKPQPYQIGDVYVAALPDLKEVEIEDVMHGPDMVKLKGEGWLERRTFEGAVKAKLGRVVYSGGLLGMKRKIIRAT
jgi:hypothetical protein